MNASKDIKTSFICYGGCALGILASALLIWVLPLFDWFKLDAVTITIAACIFFTAVLPLAAYASFLFYLANKLLHEKDLKHTDCFRKIEDLKYIGRIVLNAILGFYMLLFAGACMFTFVNGAISGNNDVKLIFAFILGLLVAVYFLKQILNIMREWSFHKHFGVVAK